MMVQYKPNDPDHSILGEITNKIRTSLGEWYGHGARLNSVTPEIRTYQYCFMLRYIVSISSTDQKAILVKIRRNPKMDSLHQAIQADIHQTMIVEYQTLEFLYDRLSHAGDDFGAIRPLLFMPKYFALLMEEYPSRSMRELMEAHVSSGQSWEASELKDAARKTGRWLYYFHNSINTPLDKPYTASDIFQEATEYVERIETVSRGRVRARPVLDAFSKILDTLQIERMKFSGSHLDMTTNNVLYSPDGRVCIIDMKNRIAPVYVDLGLILTFPETSKPQIFSAGTHYPEGLLRMYRAEIVAGYFGNEGGDERLVRIYSAIQVLNKWFMYEELISRYKGTKRLLAIPAGPYISTYFHNLFKKHMDLIESSKEPGPASKMENMAGRP